MDGGLVVGGGGWFEVSYPFCGGALSDIDNAAKHIKALSLLWLGSENTTRALVVGMP